MGSSKSRYNNQYPRDSQYSSGGSCAPNSCYNPCQMNSCATPFPSYAPFNSYTGYGYYTGTLVGYGYGF
ncbi:hypothetical protein BpHYR1_034668 [Brachionus plicatilis]|uniref:Uncharacterized protein n=1 Tax=Brachionus plicatilis TaxID=10195 RepID=A0A3M7S278_BRAPC|nr:hypothetical protein BpHYR1_034668 [Brachionus plicatilis]